MKNRLFIVFCLLFTFTSFCQEFKKMSDVADVKAKLKVKMASTLSMSADFKETTYSSMFDAPKKASGLLCFKQKQKIRWEHTSPIKNVLLIDGNSVKYSEKGREVKDPTTKMVVKKIQGMMVKMLSGDFLNEKEFTISYSENTTAYKLKLTPKSSRIGKYIESISLVFSKTDLLLKEMTMSESESDKVVYAFSNMKVNESINDLTFKKF